MERTSTFKRAASSSNTVIQGVKPSVHNGQLLISSGLADLDTHLGGGIPLGSVLLLFEDTTSNYSNCILNYYLSEGISCGHNVAYLGLPDNLENTLPLNYTKWQQTEQSSESESSTAVSDGDSVREEARKEQNASANLRISWRYEQFVQDQIALKQQSMKNKTFSSGSSASRKIGSVQCHEYDISKPIQPELVEQARNNSTLYESSPHIRGKLFALLEQVRKFTTAQSANNESSCSLLNTSQVTRIGIRSIQLSYLDDEDAKYFHSVAQFLHLLKVLCRKSLSTAFITVPKNHSNIDMLQIIKNNCCDIVFRMESFVGEHINVSDWEMSEYTGLFHIEKLPRMNTLAPYLPDTLNYAFKIKRRKVYIEKMSAPPEESRSATVKDRPRYAVEGKSTIVSDEPTKKDLEF
jgi:elongator complex protein 4